MPRSQIKRATPDLTIFRASAVWTIYRSLGDFKFDNLAWSWMKRSPGDCLSNWHCRQHSNDPRIARCRYGALAIQKWIGRSPGGKSLTTERRPSGAYAWIVREPGIILGQFGRRAGPGWGLGDIRSGASKIGRYFCVENNRPIHKNIARVAPVRCFLNSMSR